MIMTVRSCKVNVDQSSALRAAAFATAENVVSDCTRYVPIWRGWLRDSKDTRHNSDGSASVLWGTDADTAEYARRQYYDTGLQHTADLNQSNTGTGAHWFETAKASRESAWKRIFEETYKARL